jgi:predicted glycoside hydrolase/deacetylase ChbG (UPF0249 family)
VKYLIVNGDDLGASHGVNRGILEAHEHGILTSASLLVDRPWSAEAAALARSTPSLSVGLHADLDSPQQGGARASLLRQLTHFEQLVGGPPTHLDSHHNVHRSPQVLADVLVIAAEHGLIVREFSKVRCVPEFYGQWGGRTHLEQIGVAGLVHLLRTRVEDGVTELSCHPGYVDSDLVSGYTSARECELRTLCDSSVRAAIREAGIMLVSFRDVPRLLTEPAIQA